ncbi:MFS transporter [Pectinatus frisingensis]|uniref:MFS transporter n=1 Tax=Pectinatus frisingensis TaxID=865 RepID=UPI0018C73FDE|nr:MFS transporter [Pectinatus frisingensis]
MADNQLYKADPFPWKFVTPLYMGSTLNPINSSIIATALVPIALSLHISASKATLLITVLYLTSSIAQPTAGRLSTQFGPRRIFLCGIVMVLIGGVLGGAGYNFTMLIIARIFIGIGTSTAYPSAMLIIHDRTKKAALQAPPGRVLGWLQVTGVATAAIGLPIGGLLLDTWGWRMTFLVNIPVAMTALIMVAVWIPRDGNLCKIKNIKEIIYDIDIIGIVYFTLIIISLLMFLYSLPEISIKILAISGCLIIAAIKWETRIKRPFIDVKMFLSNLALTRTYLRFMLMTLCMYTVLYGITTWLESTRAVSPAYIGLLMLPMSVASALVVEPVSKRNLVKKPLIISSILTVFASLAILMANIQTALYNITFITFLFGIAMGLMLSANQTALYMQSSENNIGVTAGLFRTFGYIGSIGSSALIGTVFTPAVTDAGMRTIALLIIMTSLVSLILTVMDKKISR